MQRLWCVFGWVLGVAHPGLNNKPAEHWNSLGSADNIVAMTTPVSSIRNLGPAYEKALASAGIRSAEDLRALGADKAYLRLLETGTKPHFIGYYVLVMALQGRPWNDCKGEEKKALRERFDKIKGAGFDKRRSDFESFLDQIGVIEKK